MNNLNHVEYFEKLSANLSVPEFKSFVENLKVKLHNGQKLTQEEVLTVMDIIAVESKLMAYRVEDIMSVIEPSVDFMETVINTIRSKK
jgi:hypothetical protein